MMLFLVLKKAIVFFFQFCFMSCTYKDHYTLSKLLMGWTNETLNKLQIWKI